jgi:hypothetical protein
VPLSLVAWLDLNYRILVGIGGSESTRVQLGGLEGRVARGRGQQLLVDGVEFLAVVFGDQVVLIRMAFHSRSCSLEIRVLRRHFIGMGLVDFVLPIYLAQSLAPVIDRAQG